MSDEKIVFPLAAIVSDLNREGFASLVKDEMGGVPETFLFETLDDARKRVTEIARKTYRIA